MPRLHIEFGTGAPSIVEQVEQRKDVIYDATAVERCDLQKIADCIAYLGEQSILEKRVIERSLQKLLRRISAHLRERKYQA